jgi:hypothetical protein
MGMTRISFDVPEDVLLSLNESEQDFAREARVLTADYDAEDFRREIGRSNA